MFKKLLSTIIAVSLILNAFFITYAGANLANDSLSFVQQGNKYIYSNNPEQLLYSHLLGGIGAYTISQSLTSNTNYSAEFSHINYTSNNLTIGVMICNVNSTAQTVRVYNNKYATSGPLSNYTSIGASVETNYWNASAGYTDYSIPANKTLFICSTVVSHGNIATGKVLFKPLANNMYAKVVFVKQGSEASAISVGGITGDGAPQTTATYNTDTRSTTYNYSTAINKRFYLSLVSPTSPAVSNSNESESPLYYLPNTNPTLMGNYGINYFITFQNATGKTLRITPDWASVHLNGYTSQDYSIFNGSTWQTIHFNDNSYYDYVVPSAQVIKFILPGGNTGNVQFKFIN